MKKIISLTVMNKSGVLNRITNLFQNETTTLKVYR